MKQIFDAILIILGFIIFFEMIIGAVCLLEKIPAFMRKENAYLAQFPDDEEG